ncbi:GmrSD restriction endonuclease domain-containing protein [Neobacillus sp. Marseille-QA0830]
MKEYKQISLFENIESVGNSPTRTLPENDDKIEKSESEQYDDETMEDDNNEFVDDEEEQDDDPVSFIIGRKVDFNRSERRIRDLKADESDGILEKQPIFQRNYVWNDKKASLLIESILLNVPIPLIFTAEDKDSGTELVVDGQQRITSVFEYIDGKFPLSGLKIFHELNGKTFKQLDRVYQLKINRYPFSVIKISGDSDEEVKFEIFERINSGAANLNDQELRNCIYRGYYNEFIKKLAKSKLLVNLMFGGNVPKRMENTEMVIRFLAFHLGTLSNYPGSLKRFLNAHMKEKKIFFDNLEEPERESIFKNYQKKFNDSLQLAFTVFGNRAFRSVTINSHGQLQWTKLNKVLFDLIMVSFAQYEKSQIIPYSDSIREALIQLILNDRKFLPQDGTLLKLNVQYRFNLWNAELQSIVGHKKQPRSFSYQLKEELYKSDPTCKLCHQRIHHIDDSVVDHDNPYWRGGETIPENAKLMHIDCNRRKNGKY